MARDLDSCSMSVGLYSILLMLCFLVGTGACVVDGSQYACPALMPMCAQSVDGDHRELPIRRRWMRRSGSLSHSRFKELERPFRNLRRATARALKVRMLFETWEHAATLAAALRLFDEHMQAAHLSTSPSHCSKASIHTNASIRDCKVCGDNSSDNKSCNGALDCCASQGGPEEFVAVADGSFAKLPLSRHSLRGGGGKGKKRKTCHANATTSSADGANGTCGVGGMFYHDDFIDDSMSDPALELLVSLGLQQKPIAKDGNCLFASICDQLTQHRVATTSYSSRTSTVMGIPGQLVEATTAMRRDLAAYMVAHQEQFLPFFATETSPITAFAENCHYMCKTYDTHK